jgi:hypothetical protein
MNVGRGKFSDFTQRFKRLESAPSFFATFRPEFRGVGHWCTGIPCYQYPNFELIALECISLWG